MTRAIVDEARLVMASCNLASYDAAPVATALATGAAHLVAVDGHFARAAQLLSIHIMRDTQPPAG